jgi:hypothetical protein
MALTTDRRTEPILPDELNNRAFRVGNFDESIRRLERIRLYHYNVVMERVFRRFANFEEAEQHDIEYYIHLSVDQRQAIARVLKKRAYGDDVPDIREYHKRK